MDDYSALDKAVAALGKYQGIIFTSVNGVAAFWDRLTVLGASLVPALKIASIVHEIAAYRTLPAAPDPQGLTEVRRGVDAITFTSSSTVRNFVLLLSGSAQYIDAANYRRMGHNGIPMPSLNRAIIACIGPITAQTAREVGLPVDVMATEYTMDGLLAALVEYFSHPDLQVMENRWLPTRSLS